MRMRGPAIALMAIYGLIGILEIAFTRWEAFTSRVDSLQDIDTLAQTPLALVLLAGLVGLVLKRRGVVPALFIYSTAGVALGLASTLSAVVPGAQRASEAGFGTASVIFAAAIAGAVMFAVRSGCALVLLAPLLSEHWRERLFDRTSESRVA